MRTLIILLLFPLSLFSQELPDSIIASNLGVKKLIILQQSKKSPVDTFGVFILDGVWKTQAEMDDTSTHDPVHTIVISNDTNGRSTFTWDKKNPKCKSDSIGILHKYDAEGKLIQWVYYTCNSQKFCVNYYYNDQGKVLLAITPSKKEIRGSREEYIYDKKGMLLSITSWTAENPMSPDRTKYDIKYSKVTFYYDKNGLIKETQLDDPDNLAYDIQFDYEDSLPEMKFTYIYIY